MGGLPFRGAIFDMDGTLLDSMPVWDQLSQRYLKQYDITVTQADYQAIEGTTQQQGAQYFLKTYPSIPLDVDTFLGGLNRLITARYEELARPKDGVREFLERLRRQKVEMAVATLTARQHAEKALRDNGLSEYFSFLLTIEDVGVSKRQPDIYLQTAERMQLPPEACCVFEDAPYAGETAKKAGFQVCGLAEPAYCAGEELLRRNSDYFIEHSYAEWDESREGNNGTVK